MAKGVKGTGPRSKFKPASSEIPAAARVLTGWKVTADQVAQLRAEKMRAVRKFGTLTPEQIKTFEEREERAKKVQREASKRAAAMISETQRLQGFAKVGLVQTAIDALPDAFRTVFVVMLSEETAPHVKLEAAKMIREWAFARPQDVGGLKLDGAADVRDVSELNASELSAMSEELARMIAAKREAAAGRPAIESEPVAEGVPEPAEPAFGELIE